MLIVNPNATSTTEAARDTIAQAMSSRLSVRVELTDHRGHAGELAQQAIADGADLIAVHGGDGTVNEVVNGMLGAATPAPDRSASLPAVAVIPGGSANVFARSLGIANDPLEATQQVFAAVAAGSVREVGLGGADDRWFLFNGGLGWDADVVNYVEQRRSEGKEASPARYFRSTVRALVDSATHPPRLTVEIPGQEPHAGVYMVFVTGTDPWTYFGERAVHTNPGTSFDGGLGLFGVTSLGLLTLGRLVPAMLTRGADPRAKKLVRLDDVAEMTVRCAPETGFQLDGEYLGMRSKVHFYRVPRALRVLVPAR